MKKYLFLLVTMVSGSVLGQSHFDDLYYTPPKKDKKAQTSVNNKITEPQTTQPVQPFQNEVVGYEYFDVDLGEFVWVDGENELFIGIGNKDEYTDNSITLEINSYKNIFDLPNGVYEVEVRDNYVYFLNSDIDGMTNIYELNEL